MAMTSWADTCSLCKRSRFWPSRSGYFVCAVCCPDALQALIILARRGPPGAIKRAQGWVDAHASASTTQMEAHCSIDIHE